MLRVALLFVAIIAAALPSVAGLPRGSGTLPTPPLSPVVTPTASTIVAKWTTSAASNSTGGCSTTNGGPYTILAVDNGIETSVTSHFIVVAGLVPSTTYYCKISSGVLFALFTQVTNAPPTTTPVIGVTVGSASQPVVNQVHGDFFGNCVSNDGKAYVSTDDMHGWGGVSLSANMSLNVFITESPLTGANLNGLSNFGGFNTPLSDGKTSKVMAPYCDGGNIYLLYTRLDAGGSPFSLTQGSILKSTDHGVSWSNGQAPNTYNVNGAVPSPLSYTMFANSSLGASCTWVSYGADDGTLAYPDNADAYVYLICNDGIYNGSQDHIYLIRIPHQSLPGLDATAIQYYTGAADGSLDAAWSSSAGSILAMTVPSLPTQQLGVPTMQWMQSTGRYIFVDAYNKTAGISGDTVMLAWESPHPWGPFTKIGGPTEYTPSGFYSQIAFQRTAHSATCNGVAMTFLMSGDFSTNTWYNLWAQDWIFLC